MSEKPDIVERLKLAAEPLPPGYEQSREDMALMSEASAEIERLRAALEKISEHHEDQAEAWGGEEGDTNNVRYHSECARFANAALNPPA